MMTLYPIFIILWYGKQLTAWIKDEKDDEVCLFAAVSVSHGVAYSLLIAYV